MYAVVDPRHREWQRRCVQSFVSQLEFLSATGERATWTRQQQLSWIASLLPADDCWTVIPKLVIEGEMAIPGEEGADLLIEILPPPANAA